MSSAMVSSKTSTSSGFPLPRPRSASEQFKNIARTVNAKQMREGGGFVVRRPVGGGSGLSSRETDPYLMLDHMGPVIYAPGEAVGAPDHPHRGFETVTYILKGGVEHLDSQGNGGTLGPGMVQWMTAGSGVIHSEMPSEELLRNGGEMEGFQLWVNLPAQDKMCAPRYQDTPSEAMPRGTTEDGLAWVKVIAGASEAVPGEPLVSPIETRSPMLYADVVVQPGGSFVQSVPLGFSGFVYVYRGSGTVCDSKLHMGEAGLLAEDGEVVRLVAELEELRVLIIAGVPLGEPIAQYGPFVMNTEAEIKQAFVDFQEGRLGEIAGARERQEETKAAREAQVMSGTWEETERNL